VELLQGVGKRPPRAAGDTEAVKKFLRARRSGETPPWRPGAPPASSKTSER
jgi:hypothetical protein